jgi:hypothetical protein
LFLFVARGLRKDFVEVVPRSLQFADDMKDLGPARERFKVKALAVRLHYLKPSTDYTSAAKTVSRAARAAPRFFGFPFAFPSIKPIILSPQRNSSPLTGED